MTLEYTIVLTPEGPAASVAVGRGRRMLLDVDLAENFPGGSVSVTNRGYAMVRWQGRHELVHRFVCPPAPGLEVDHINGCPLDNRRCNLRAVSHGLNILAGRTRPRHGPYRGVARQAGRRRYRARLTWQGRFHDLGAYPNPVLAALARDDGVVRITGHAEGLNFPYALSSANVGRMVASFGLDRFGVLFVRRTDGAVRRMVCCSHRLARVDVEALGFAPARRRLWPVWDLREKCYRFIPLEGVLCLTHQRKRYRVTLSAC